MDLLKEVEILGYLLEQINAIENYTSGLNEDRFLSNDLVRNASLMKLLVLGEYSQHIDEEIKNRFPEVQWQLMRAARNYFAHVYKGVEWLMVWETIVTDIPQLKSKFEHIIVVLESENNG